MKYKPYRLQQEGSEVEEATYDLTKDAGWSTRPRKNFPEEELERQLVMSLVGRNPGFSVKGEGTQNC